MAQSTLEIAANHILDTFYNYPASYGPTIVAGKIDINTAMALHHKLYSLAPYLFIALRHDGECARFFSLSYDEALYFPFYCLINGY